jgi:hypothetical protein
MQENRFQIIVCKFNLDGKDHKSSYTKNTLQKGTKDLQKIRLRRFKI